MKSALSRPIIYDLTHLRQRATVDAPSGIDRVDLAFGRHFAHASPARVEALHYGLRSPQLCTLAALRSAVAELDARWRERQGPEEDARFAVVRGWLIGGPKPWPSTTPGVRKSSGSSDLFTAPRRWARFARYLRSGAVDVPGNAIYLNIAQHQTETPQFFAWLKGRTDVTPVFFVHDLLPIDHPEFWWDGHQVLFERRAATIFGSAKAIITSTEVGRARIIEEIAKRGITPIPVFSYTLPSPLDLYIGHKLHDEALAAANYFVVVGTIEPRKNHALLLSLWRRYASRGKAAPKLLVIGARGWENANVVGMLERCLAISDNVIEASGLGAELLARIIANARALLMPSFAEGYGLPVVEALSLGTSAIVSDIPTFREISQGKAIFIDPLDGAGWDRAIQGLADPDSDLARQGREAAVNFRPVAETVYFEAIERFLATL